jgi:predicted ATPase with chaperone activity
VTAQELVVGRVDYYRTKYDLMMIDPPGSGKSMLARRLTTIFPVLSFDEILKYSRSSFRKVVWKSGMEMRSKLND